ncbi:hypothetical protein CH063_02772 [Colletotrichum higginsianum]|uniref:Uncharacterized protein n=2 Tax=Colletotrichum higginsianum TaxID=80884 RepID=H1VPN3_COLHI|nr:hypothetical protein CH63R_07317 [Colletotrichum higginsianum IMI 349063]OBR08552.1 hypothetical protein CH63R_07317 [Colletotrichum higginsianum IMI 349063]TIC95110.1 hypothetical protein CH35J_008754 [Colletotrichum higginsianum]GJC97374.1 hypothetical protein ColKHC_06200 [Colletotrichum higginsianum]CCF42189.1 hypothetical protein CH063_02772 [Colletotrichum higginsianum]
MAELHARLGEASKEELVQVLAAVCGHAPTRSFVETVLDYLDKKKIQEAEAAANRRSRRSCTRASSEVSQVGPGQATHKTIKRAIKLCEVCHEAFEEKKNPGKSCSFHPGSWLIECERDGFIWFEPVEDAAEEFKADHEALRILSCCNAEDGMSKGCAATKHVPMVVVDGPHHAVEVEVETGSDN